MVKISPIKETKTKNYIIKEITITPDKENQVFTFKQVKDYYEKRKDSFLSKGKVIVRGENILRSTSLKGWDQEFKTQEQYDVYAKSKVADEGKFDKLYSFTISIYETIK
jgi:hypothetical protein